MDTVDDRLSSLAAASRAFGRAIAGSDDLLSAQIYEVAFTISKQLVSCDDVHKTALAALRCLAEPLGTGQDLFGSDADERLPGLVRASHDFSRALAGSDNQLFVELFHVAFEIAAQLATGGADVHEAATKALDRLGEPLRWPEHEDLRMTIYTNSVYIESALRIIPLAMNRSPALAGVSRWQVDDVFRGLDPIDLDDGRDPRGAFLDCVAVGSTGTWHSTDRWGSGTLIADNLVLTAAHNPTEYVVFGDRLETPLRTVQVDKVVHPPGYRYRPEENTHRPDLAILVLTERVDFTPRRRAPAGALEGEDTVTVAGFGAEDARSIRYRGTKRMAVIPRAGTATRYGGERYEFVAADPLFSRDSCRMDSGGPAYVASPDGTWVLVGVTARKLPVRVRGCGDGSVYTGVGPFEDWISTVCRAHA